MKVKELIEYLEKRNPEDIVGILDCGQDSGDWVILNLSEGFVGEDIYPNFKIKTKKEVIKELSNRNEEYLLEYEKELLEELKIEGEE